MSVSNYKKYNVAEFCLMICGFIDDNICKQYPFKIKINKKHYKKLYYGAGADADRIINNYIILFNFCLEVDEDVPDFMVDIITENGNNVRLSVLTDEERIVKDIIE